MNKKNKLNLVLIFLVSSVISSQFSIASDDYFGSTIMENYELESANNAPPDNGIKTVIPQIDGIKLPNTHVTEIPNELIRLQDLSVTYEYNDVKIPGPNGLDLELKRELGTIQLVGSVKFNSQHCAAPSENNKVIVDVPLTEMTTVGYSNANKLQAGTLLSFNNGYILKCVNNIPVIITNTGLTMTFGKNLVYADDTPRRTYVTTSIADRFGNVITYNYGDDYLPLSGTRKNFLLDSISRNDGAEIRFEYEILGNQQLRYLKYAKYGTPNVDERQVEYTYANRFGSIKLVKFTDQEANETDYSYANWGVGGIKLRQVDFHTGLSIYYEYTTYDEDLGLFGELSARTISGPDIDTHTIHYIFNNGGCLNCHILTIRQNFSTHDIIRRIEIYNKGSTTPYSNNERALDTVLVGRIKSDTLFYDSDPSPIGVNLTIMYSDEYEWSTVRHGDIGCAPIYGFVTVGQYQICARAILNKKTTKYWNSNGTDTFIYDPTAYDEYGNELQSRSSIVNSSVSYKYTKQFYLNSIQHWLIGLPTTTQVSFDGSSWQETDKNVYFDADHQYKNKIGFQFKYGQMKESFDQYHTNGDLKRVKTSGTPYYELYEDYKFGIAQKTTIPTRYNNNTVVSTQVVNDFGEVTSATDYDGTTTDYTFDDLGRLTYTNYNDCVSASSCDFQNELTTYNDSLNTVTTIKGNYKNIIKRDALQRIIFESVEDITDSFSKKTNTIDYDLFGNKVYESFPVNSLIPSVGTGLGIEYEYDNLNRKTKETVKDSNETIVREIEYLKDNKIEYTDGESNISTVSYLSYGNQSYDMPNLIVQDGTTTTIGYNVFDNIDNISQGSITETRLYDSHQQLCKIVRPDTGKTAYGYYSSGLLNWVAYGTSGSNFACGGDTATDRITYTYDSLNDLNTKSDNNGVFYNKTKSKYNNDSATMFIDGIYMWYIYDKRNRLIEKGNENGINITRWTYDSLSNVKTIFYPDNQSQVIQNTNALGEIKDILIGGSNHPLIKLTNIKYHPSGGILSFNYGNGVKRNVTRRNSGLPTQIEDKKGSQIIFKHTYSYDDQSNLTSLIDSVDSSYNLSNITYDGQNRLDTLTGFWGSSNFDYDSLSNITQMKLGSQTINYNYGNTTNRLNSISGASNQSFIYDSAGNTTNNGSRSFQYDNLNRMISSGNISYKYDDNDLQRYKKVGTGNPLISIYGIEDKLLLNYESSSNKTKYFYLNGEQIAKVKTTNGSSELIYLHNDSLTSLAVETNTSGQVINRYHYEPFGFTLEAGQSDSPGFTGHIYDDDLTLNYMKARYYDPQIGRFYTNDPVGFDVNNPTSFNRYSYANNNPYKYIDKTGENIVLWVGGIGDSVISFAKGDGFNPNGNLSGALLDGYDGGAQDIGSAALEDIVAFVPVAQVTKIAKFAGKFATKIKNAIKRCCFVAGTQVLTIDGYKNIEDVKLGQLLWAKNVETGESDWKQVSKIFVEHDRGIYNIKVEGSKGDQINIEATDDHPFYTVDKGWKTTIELDVGDYLETKGMGRVKVVEVINEHRNDVTYNFTIDDFHTYYVTETNVLVHNCPTSGKGGGAAQKGKRAKVNDDASEQFEGIDKAQRRQRKNGDNVSIQSTKKSKQREKNQLKNIDINKLDGQ